MGVALALLCSLLFSSSYITVQMGMRKSREDNGAFLSLFYGTICIFLVYIVARGLIYRTVPEFNWPGVLYYLLAGFCSVYLGRIMLYFSIRNIGSTRAIAIKNTAPVFAVLMAVSFLSERLSLLGSLGISIILISLLSQTYRDYKFNPDVSKINRKGMMAAVAAAFLAGASHIARKQGVELYPDPILGSLIGSVFALIAYLLTDLFRGRLIETLRHNFLQTNPYYVLSGFLSGGALICFLLSLMHTNVSYTSVVAASEPVVTVILVRLFLHREERITPSLIATACAVFLGCIIIALSK